MYIIGSSEPPSSNFLRVSSVPVGWLVAIGLLVLAGEVTALVLLILNIVMRKNKYASMIIHYLVSLIQTTEAPNNIFIVKQNMFKRGSYLWI